MIAVGPVRSITARRAEYLAVDVCWTRVRVVARAVVVFVLSGLLAGTAAHADRAIQVVDQRRVTIGDIVFEAANGLSARRGPLRTRLSGPPFDGGGLTVHQLVSARLGDDGQAVTLGYQDYCTDFSMRFTLREVEARLVNVAGLELHRKHQWAAAAGRFAEAARLDPGFDFAVQNLASALALDGKVPEAVAALRSRLAAHPVATYLDIIADPELASLVEAPEVRGVRASKPGAATLATTRHLAYAPERKLIAARIVDPCGLSGASSQSLAIADLAGTQIASVQISGCEGASSSGTARGDRALADLGFQPIADLDFQWPIDNHKVRLAKERLGVVTPGRGGNRVRVIRGDKVVVERSSIAESLTWAAFVPAANAVAVGWARDQPEAECGNAAPYTGMDVLALP